jgi:hypothetical protein
MATPWRPCYFNQTWLAGRNADTVLFWFHFQVAMFNGTGGYAIDIYVPMKKRITYIMSLRKSISYQFPYNLAK